MVFGVRRVQNPLGAAPLGSAPSAPSRLPETIDFIFSLQFLYFFYIFFIFFYIFLYFFEGFSMVLPQTTDSAMKNMNFSQFLSQFGRQCNENQWFLQKWATAQAKLHFWLQNVTECWNTQLFQRSDLETTECFSSL